MEKVAVTIRIPVDLRDRARAVYHRLGLEGVPVELQAIYTSALEIGIERVEKMRDREARKRAPRRDATRKASPAA